jgi:hypothetical protein
MEMKLAISAAAAIVILLFANSSYEHDMKICQLTQSEATCVNTLR